jgi:hypothetical protein
MCACGVYLSVPAFSLEFPLEEVCVEGSSLPPLIHPYNPLASISSAWGVLSEPSGSMFCFGYEQGQRVTRDTQENTRIASA